MGLSDTVFSDDEEEEDEETHLNRFLTRNNNNKNLSASRYKHPKDVEQACLRLHVTTNNLIFFKPHLGILLALDSKSSLHGERF